MTAAMDRDDLDEASRQGALAGPSVVERALAAPSRTARLAGIAAAPAVEDRAELIPALARLASGPDRRTAIPAALAARTIARRLAQHELPDDLAADDVASWRASCEAIARRGELFVEVRVIALETAAELARAIDPGALGFELPALLADSDPALRAAAVDLVPRPVPAALRPALVATFTGDADPQVRLAAAAALCSDDGDLDRLRALVKDPGSAGARCLR